MTDKYAQPEPYVPEHLPEVAGESIAERIQRVMAARDRQRSVSGHQEVLATGRARSKRMKGSAGQ